MVTVYPAQSGVRYTADALVLDDEEAAADAVEVPALSVTLQAILCDRERIWTAQQLAAILSLRFSQWRRSFSDSLPVPTPRDRRALAGIAQMLRPVLWHPYSVSTALDLYFFAAAVVFVPTARTAWSTMTERS